MSPSRCNFSHRDFTEYFFYLLDFYLLTFPLFILASFNGSSSSDYAVSNNRTVSELEKK
jgi:hypothetical protein